MADCPNVIDIRNLGLIVGIELAPREGRVGERGMEAFHKAFDEGLLIRVTGDIIALSPPLMISAEQIEIMFSQLGRVLRQLA